MGGGVSIFKFVVYFGLLKRYGYNDLLIWFLGNENKLEVLISEVSLRI